MLGQAALLICLLIVGTEAGGEVKTTLKYQSACCLSPFEKFIDDKEVSKCGKVSDTCISSYREWQTFFRIVTCTFKFV